MSFLDTLLDRLSDRLQRLAPGENRHPIKLAIRRARLSLLANDPTYARRYAGNAERMIEAAEARARGRELRVSACEAMVSGSRGIGR